MKVYMRTTSAATPIAIQEGRKQSNAPADKSNGKKTKRSRRWNRLIVTRVRAHRVQRGPMFCQL